MKSMLMKCAKCGRYMLSDRCPDDGSTTMTVHPARFSPDDKYARYRSPLAYSKDA